MIEEDIFESLLDVLISVDGSTFEEASVAMIDWVDNAPNFLDLVKSIGCIPESLDHDSTAEKLFSKVSDAVLARSFRELGLKATVVKERSDSGDVQASSKYHNYSLVADAKAFRLSRTARNQKDFKVTALSGWRKDLDYAVLCAPYFQYPTSKSQIYQQAITHNVALFSWEYLTLMLKKKTKESIDFDMSPLWNWSCIHSAEIPASNLQKCFLREQDSFLEETLKISADVFCEHMNKQVQGLRQRSQTEIAFWKNQEQLIREYSREKAISELLKAKKVERKIETIEKYIAGLSYE